MKQVINMNYAFMAKLSKPIRWGGSRRLLLSLILIVSFVCPIAYSKSGPPIPTPAQTLEKALIIASEFFAKNLLGRAAWKNGDEGLTITAVQYTHEYIRGFAKEDILELGEWSWIVSITNLVENERAWVIQVHRNGEVKILARSI